MAKKKQLDKVTLVKEMSRNHIGQVKKGSVVPDKRRKALDRIREQEGKEAIRES